MNRTKISPETLGRHRGLLDEVLSLKGLSHRPLVELFELPNLRGVSHSGGVPAFSEDAWLLMMDYNVRSGQTLSDETEAGVRKILERVKTER